MQISDPSLQKSDQATGLKKQSAWITFLHRGFSSILLVSLLYGAYLINSPYVYLGLFVVLCGIVSLEWCQMLKTGGMRSWSLLIVGSNILYPLILGLLMIEVVPFSIVTLWVMIVPALVTILAFLWELRQPVEGLKTLQSLSGSIISFIYPTWMTSFGLLILFGISPLAGLKSFVWIVLVTKIMDMGAYISGSFFGKHKMIPHISPKKTWEGFLGAIIITVGMGIWVHSLWFSGDASSSIAVWSTMTVAWVSLALGLLSVVGDLAGSLIKRSLGVKDSGKVLPGIGGVFDLVDSPAFTLPIAFILILLV